MTNHVLLNNIDHKNLKVLTERSEQYGDNLNCALAYPVEFRSLQAHYPIFFQKHPDTDQFHAVALLGFEKNENLFLDAGIWNANYIPLSMDHRPFLIGFQNDNQMDGSDEQLVIHIDMDDPRVNETDGEAVFLPQGGNTPFLEKVATVLQTMHQGHHVNKPFMDMLSDYDLFESFTLDIELTDGSNNRLAGFYTVNEDKLNGLDAEQLAKLHERGYLQAVHMAMASLSNVRELIDRKNATLESALAG